MTVAEILAQSSNVGAITLAQQLGAERLARGSSASASASRPGSTSPARRPGIVLPLEQVVGLDDRQRPDRPGHRGHAGADGGRVRGGRERRRLGAAAPRRRASAAARPRASSGGGSCRAPSRRSSRRCSRASSPREAPASPPRFPATTSRARPAPPRSRPDGSGYSTSRYVASFVGFVPATSPRLVVLVTVDEPSDDLGRRRRGAGVPADRAVRAPVPRGPAGRPGGLTAGAEGRRPPPGWGLGSTRVPRCERSPAGVPEQDATRHERGTARG